MEKKEPIAQPAIALIEHAKGRCEKRLCSNRSGHGTRCKRPAVEGKMRCAKCAACARRTRVIHWASTMVNQSKTNDRPRPFTWREEDYITKEWLLDLYKTRSQCYWCGAGYLSTVTRRRNHGIQVERLSNKLPHLKRNCVFACAHCNRRSWLKTWKEEPFHLRKYRYCFHPKLRREVRVIQDRLCLEIKALNLT